MTRPVCTHYHPTILDGCRLDNHHCGPERSQCLGCSEYSDGEQFMGPSTEDTRRREDWSAMWALRVPVAHMRPQAA